MGGGKEGREGMGWEIGREWLRGRGREGGRGEEEDGEGGEGREKERR